MAEDLLRATQYHLSFCQVAKWCCLRCKYTPKWLYGWLLMSGCDFEKSVVAMIIAQVTYIEVNDSGVIFYLRPSSPKNIEVHPSVCLSVCSSVTSIWQSYYHVIFRYCHWQMWCPCKRSRSEVKLIEVKKLLPQFGNFRTITPVLHHRGLRNDAQNSRWHKRSSLMFLRENVNFRGHTGRKIEDVDPNWARRGCNSSLNLLVVLKWCTKFEVA